MFLRADVFERTAERLDSRVVQVAGSLALGYALSWTDSPESIPLLRQAIDELRAHGWDYSAVMGERALARIVAVAATPGYTS